MSTQSHISLSLFHIFAVVPLFLYVSFMRGQAVPWIFTALLVLGAIVLMYHTFKVILKWHAASPSLWVNIIHVFFVAPLMIYIGVKGYDTPRWAYEVLAMLGFSALGYHIYSIVLEVQDLNDRTKAIKRASSETN